MRLSAALKETLDERDALKVKLTGIEEKLSDSMSKLENYPIYDSYRDDLTAEVSRLASDNVAMKHLLNSMMAQSKDAELALDALSKRFNASEAVKARLEEEISELRTEAEQSLEIATLRRLEKDNALLRSQILDKSSIMGLKTQLNEAMSEMALRKAQRDQKVAEYQMDVQSLSEKLSAIEFELKDERLTTERLKLVESSNLEEIEQLRTEIEQLKSKLGLT
jgi:chromosome segregation ATPase